jgi:hypothetical protein
MLKHVSLVSESAAANIGLCRLASRKHGQECKTKSLRKNVVREGGLLVFKSGRQKVKYRLEVKKVA